MAWSLLVLSVIGASAPAGAADALGPAVSFVSPAHGATVSGTVPVNVQATDPDGVFKVRVWIDSTYLGYDMTYPYVRNWNTNAFTNGRHTIKTQALDTLNNSTTKTITVTVINPDTTAPTVSITAPANGATVSGNVAITANAADNKGLQKVRFWAGATYLGYDSAPPFAATWNASGLANGPYVIKAQAVDWANNTKDAQITVNVGASTTMLGGCPVFPSDNAWNTDISSAPVHPNSAAYIANIGLGGSGKLHADFGGGGEYGIPYMIVPPSQPPVPVEFTDYGDESDPGPYPIPLNAPIEGGSDRHTLALQQGTCKLYELFNAAPVGGHWEASSGAIWDLTSNALRPPGWTSADAAGLPILPGLARYDEVQSGVITHAQRVTVGQSQKAYILPATHWASTSTDASRPPMGLRLRLKANFDLSGYSGDALVILTALKKYGLIVADNGTSWYITGAMDPRWDDDDLNQLKTVPGSAFEAVYTGPIVTP